MATVQSYESCKKCNGVMMYNFNTRSGEEHGMCFRCGYGFKYLMVRNDDGEIQFEEIDGKKVPKMKLDESGSYGIIYLSIGEEGFGQYSTPTEPIIKEHLDEIIETIETNDEINKDRSFIISYENGKAKAVYGTPNSDSYLSFEAWNKQMYERYA